MPVKLIRIRLSNPKYSQRSANKRRRLGLQIFKRHGAKSTRITGMMHIIFLFPLFARNRDFLCVDHNNKITSIHMGGIGRFVLAARMESMNTTYSAKKDDLSKEWFVVDATGQTLGKLAVQIANIQRYFPSSIRIY